jgi:hypothetical protein
MPYALPRRLLLAGYFLVLTPKLPAQEAGDDPQRVTLTGLRHFAVSARVQLSGTGLESIDERALRAKLEAAMRREGIGVVGPQEVRDGTQAEIALQYLVVSTRDQTGRRKGFAASSCMEAAQLVRLQRRTPSGGPVYAVVPTWRSCGIVTGDSLVYGQSILQNADQQIRRFIRAWRQVNRPPSLPAPQVESRESRVTSHESRATSFGSRLMLRSVPSHQLYRVLH